MTFETNELVYVDGQLAIKYTASGYMEPKLMVSYWGFGHTARTNVDHLIGKEVKDLHQDGRYSIHFAGSGLCSQYVTLRLPEGGATKAFKQEETPWPCPKVRKGIETRYYYGQWQKYLKTEGWVSL